MHHLEQLVELFLAPGDAVRQAPQLPAKLDYRSRGVVRRARWAIAAAQLFDPCGVSIHPILQSVLLAFVLFHVGSPLVVCLEKAPRVSAPANDSIRYCAATFTEISLRRGSTSFCRNNLVATSAGTGAL